MIKGFAFVCYGVTDIGKAEQFYCGFLGLKKLVNWQGKWLEVVAGSGTLVLTTRFEEIGSKPGADGPVLALEVSDLDEWTERIDRENIEWFRRPEVHEYCKGGVLYDPDRNRILLHQMKEHHPNQSSQTTPARAAP